MVAFAPMVANERRLELGLARHEGARIDDVGEYAARSTEHVVLERDPLVETNVVLDLAAVTQANAASRHRASFRDKWSIRE
jgi:hypothetical protein